MQFTKFLWAAALLSLAGAQTPADFPISVQASLKAEFASANVPITPPGVLIPRQDTAVAPTLYTPDTASSSGLYVVFMIDSDVMVNNSLTTLLHWFGPNLMPTDNILMSSATAANASTAIGAPYLQPSPPLGSGPHEYTLLCFEQPVGFTVPASYVSINPPPDSSARIGFNISAFMIASGLKQPIAANYFRVLNGTAAETSSAASSAPLATASTAMSSSSTTPASTPASTILVGTATMSSTSSASATPSAAGAADVRSNARELVAGLAMAAVGAAVLI